MGRYSLRLGRPLTTKQPAVLTIRRPWRRIWVCTSSTLGNSLAGDFIGSYRQAHVGIVIGQGRTANFAEDKMEGLVGRGKQDRKILRNNSGVWNCESGRLPACSLLPQARWISRRLSAGQNLVRPRGATKRACQTGREMEQPGTGWVGASERSPSIHHLPRRRA